MTQHGVPATITSTGRVVPTWLPGEDNNLTGVRRQREAWRRLRQSHNRRQSVGLLLAARRYGFVLS